MSPPRGKVTIGLVGAEPNIKRFMEVKTYVKHEGRVAELSVTFPVTFSHGHVDPETMAEDGHVVLDANVPPAVLKLQEAAFFYRLLEASWTNEPAVLFLLSALSNAMYGAIQAVEYNASKHPRPKEAKAWLKKRLAVFYANKDVKSLLNFRTISTHQGRGDVFLPPHFAVLVSNDSKVGGGPLIEEIHVGDGTIKEPWVAIPQIFGKFAGLYKDCGAKGLLWNGKPKVEPVDIRFDFLHQEADGRWRYGRLGIEPPGKYAEGNVPAWLKEIELVPIAEIEAATKTKAQSSPSPP